MRIGFVGAGNMAEALMRGMIAGGIDNTNLMALDVNRERNEAMRAFGFQITDRMEQLIGWAELIVLAVKPMAAQDVLLTLGTFERLPDVLSIVVSLTQQTLAETLPNASGIARAMPNTPMRVGAGVTAFNDNHSMNRECFNRMLTAFSHCGRTVIVPESLMSAVTAISGSGPAYVYLFIEALADAGVKEGLARDVAYELAAQTALGASKMVLEAGMHPAALKDAVCSPGGTTIEAIYMLEKAGLRAAITDAVDACARKSEAMGKQKG